MKIQPISPSQYAESIAVITKGFAGAPHKGGHEGDLVEKLRQSATYHPDYDVIAEDDAGRIIGSALLSAATIVGEKQTWPVFVLGPLAVLPDAQHQSVGSNLIAYLEMQAGEDERRAISILGDPAYYGRFGYKPASQYGITGPFAGPEFMIKPIREGGLYNVAGRLVYDPAFGL
ncbi:GNAT family N-acetyltransferase [Lacticaseibacillus jixianensis]|uniref:GNAT family N-acetyltransferase n=1 Tax=Lacticaseibacillus jixianensis TaxID=2486012 RepID=A0ABW4B9G7_9LACO|nr:N-acetyltransferase [Lacticaseibacillus jixianensis]